MSAFHLQDLDELDQEISFEHFNWLENSSIQLIAKKSTSCDAGLLNDPNFLPKPKYVGEIQIAITKVEDPSLHSIIKLYIGLAKKKAKTQKKIDDFEQLEQFEQLYKEFLKKLKQKFLARAIEISLRKIDSEALTKFYQFPEHSLAKLQTQDDCVKKHDQITQVIKEERRKLDNNIDNTEKDKQLTQLEFLSKRQVSLFYDKPEKKTTTERVLNGVNVTSSIIGLVTGIVAAVLWLVGLVGIFFPPLLVCLAPAYILSGISFCSYAGTTINAGNIVKNLFNGRPPSTSEKKGLLFELKTLPFVIIGPILAPFLHVFKIIGIVKALRTVKSLCNNGISNVTDGLVAGETIDEACEVINDIKAKKFSQTTATSTASKVSSGLLSQSTHIMKENKVQIQSKYSIVQVEKTETRLSEAIEKHGFVYVKEKQEPELNGNLLDVIPSKFLSIVDWHWNAGFFMSIKYRGELSNIKTAQKKYMSLTSDAYGERYKALMKIQSICLDWLEKLKEPGSAETESALPAITTKNENKSNKNQVTPSDKPTDSPFEQVQKLHDAVTDESESLISFIGKPASSLNDAEDYVRPMLVGY